MTTGHPPGRAVPGPGADPVAAIVGLAALAQRVWAAPARLGPSRLVLIDGPSGAGKTSFAELLVAKLITGQEPESGLEPESELELGGRPERGSGEEPGGAAGLGAGERPGAGAGLGASEEPGAGAGLGASEEPGGAAGLSASDEPGGAAGLGASEEPGVGARLSAGVELVHTDDLLDGWDGQFSYFDRLEEQVLAPLRAGRSGSYQRYDWAAGEFGGPVVLVRPAPVVVIEGVGAASERLRAQGSLSIFVTAPAEVCAARTLARDGAAMVPYLRIWRQREAEHFRADRTMERVDVVVADLAEIGPAGSAETSPLGSSV